jgi:hypothetical protein
MTDGNFPSEEDDLRTILKNWGHFPAPTEAEFNCLLNEILGALREGFDKRELAMVIQNEFYNHFGEPGPDVAVADLAEDISIWWDGKSSSSGGGGFV